MDKLTIKTEEEIKIMARGSKLLAEIRDRVAKEAKPGVKCIELEKLACQLIGKTGGQASFKLVPGYSHATCLNVNETVVHGIPDDYRLKNGDKLGIDVGLYLDGFHADTAVTVGVGEVPDRMQGFLGSGKAALKKAVAAAKPGKRVADISAAMQTEIEKNGYSAVRALTGHGIGKKLHEEPAIPCFVCEPGDRSPIIREGMVLAIEVMYNLGTAEVRYKNDDGWTIVTADGKISGLFEHTVAITKSGPVVLTESDKSRE